jgi:hypothetical protein
LVKGHDIDSNRLSFKGYGETELIISDEQISKAKTKLDKENLHAINRQTELKVTEEK